MNSASVGCQIDSSKISQLDKDFILLSHLIPCCQHYVMGYKPEFEQEMNKRLRKGESLSGFRREAWSTFIIWLLIHPRNAPILNALVLPSLLYYNGKRPNTDSDYIPSDIEDKWAIGALMSESQIMTLLLQNSQALEPDSEQSIIRWELVLNLMRNVLTHEYRYDWLGVSRMMNRCLEVFGTRENIEDMLKLYEKCILKQKNLPESYSSYGHPYFPRTDDYWIEAWKALLLLKDLIPMRTNNSLVDEAFEDDMDEMYNSIGEEQLREEKWRIFALYLKTHPANAQVENSDPYRFSWIIVIRLCRNIIAHEQYFNWLGTIELKNKMIQFFGSEEAVRWCFERYKQRCYAPNVATDSDNNNIQPSISFTELANVQLNNRFNCCRLSNGSLFVGFDELYEFASDFYYTWKRTSRNRQIAVIYVPVLSGKTTILEHCLPYALHQISGKPVKKKIIRARKFTGQTTIDFYSFLQQEFGLEKLVTDDIERALKKCIEEFQHGEDLWYIGFDDLDIALMKLTWHDASMVINLILELAASVDCVFSASGSIVLPFSLQLHFNENLDHLQSDKKQSLEYDVVLQESQHDESRKRKRDIDAISCLPRKKQSNTVIVPFCVYRHSIPSSPHDLADLQTLLRHYTKVDKFLLKLIIRCLGELPPYCNYHPCNFNKVKMWNSYPDMAFMNVALMNMIANRLHADLPDVSLYDLMDESLQEISSPVEDNTRDLVVRHVRSVVQTIILDYWDKTQHIVQLLTKAGDEWKPIYDKLKTFVGGAKCVWGNFPLTMFYCVSLDEAVYHTEAQHPTQLWFMKGESVLELQLMLGSKRNLVLRNLFETGTVKTQTILALTSLHTLFDHNLSDAKQLFLYSLSIVKRQVPSGLHTLIHFDDYIYVGNPEDLVPDSFWYKIGEIWEKLNALDSESEISENLVNSFTNALQGLVGCCCKSAFLARLALRQWLSPDPP